MSAIADTVADACAADVLPEVLHAGDVLVSPAGTRARVMVTNKRGPCGERLYRLRYLSYGVAGREVLSRDELQGMKVRLVTGKHS